MTFLVRSADAKHFRPKTQPEISQSVWMISQVVLITIGCALRFRQYFFDRSFWGDEANIALNVTHRSYIGLTRPLAILQDAPILWLWLEKLTVQVFGESELAFRLPQVVGSVLTLAAFRLLANRLLSRMAATLALGVICISPPLLYFSSELKPYGDDAGVAVGLLLLSTYLDRNRTLSEVYFATACTVAVLFSLTAIFVAVSIVALRAIRYATEREFGRLGLLATCSLVWTAVFAWEDVRAVRPVADSAALKSFWSSGFAPTPLHLRTAINWLGHVSFLDARYPLESSVPVLVGVLLLAGVAVLLARGHSQVAVPIALTILIVVSAAILGFYPVRDRLVLFLVPLVVLGSAAVIDISSRGVFKTLAATAVLASFAGTIPHAYDRWTHPYTKNEFREVLSFAVGHRKAGQRVWINIDDDGLMNYYRDRFSYKVSIEFNLSHTACSAPDPAVSELRPGSQVWVVISIPPVFSAPQSIVANATDFLDAFRAMGTISNIKMDGFDTLAALWTRGQGLKFRPESRYGCIQTSAVTHFAG